MVPTDGDEFFLKKSNPPPPLRYFLTNPLAFLEAGFQIEKHYVYKTMYGYPL